MKTLKTSFILFLVSLNALFISTSCGKNSNEDMSFSTDKVCYVNSTEIDEINGNASYYSEIDNAVTNNELLATTYISKTRTLYHYATRDLFICAGDCFGTFNPAKYGRFENTICSSAQGYQIVNSNTIATFYLELIVDEDFCHDSEYSKVKTVYHGTNYKSISWYINGLKYYTYVRGQGKIVLSNGKIFTESNDMLIPDGSSTKYKKFYLSSLK